MAALVLAGGAVLGCTKPADEPESPAESAVRAAVGVLQEAFRERDAGRIWENLDAKSRSEADQAAITVQAKYRQADAAGKTDLETVYGLSGSELASLTGPNVLKTKPFLKKYRELPESVIAKIDVVGKQATVSYVEPDGDRKKFTLMLRDGKWKAVLALPKE